MLRRALAAGVLLLAATAAQASTVRGTVTDAISGTVLAGVQVKVVFTPTLSPISVTVNATTDASGRYVATTTSTTTSYHYVATTVLTGYDPDTAINNSKDPLGPTESDTVDFALYPTGSAPGTISGTVRDSITSTALANAIVTIAYPFVTIDPRTGLPRTTWLTVGRDTTVAGGAIAWRTFRPAPTTG